MVENKSKEFDFVFFRGNKRSVRLEFISPQDAVLVDVDNGEQICLPHIPTFAMQFNRYYQDGGLTKKLLDYIKSRIN